MPTDFFALPHFITWLIGVLFSIVSWFTIRTLKQIDKNQGDLAKKVNEMNGRLCHLEGEHEVFTKTSGHFQGKM
jgi:hypothetical protein